jgi:nucleotide-binding universal stress UspA family protein
MSTGRIVVGFDGSEPSKDALRWAKAQADATGDALVVVSAWTYPVASFPMLIDTVPVAAGADPEAETRTALQRMVKETIGDTSVVFTVVEGHPVTALLNAALDAALVVVGSRGHGGFVGSLLGSVSQHLVAHAPCPVVVVRHAKEPHPDDRLRDALDLSPLP